MKKLAIILIVIILALSVSLCACSSKVNTQPVKIAVVYFSITNNTKTVANYIADIKGADVFEIEAEVPYTPEDLSYEDNTNRSSREQADDTSRPQMKKAIDLSQYGIVYIGYPIWHSKAPRILYTFVESQEWGWTQIIPFCTSAETDIGESAILLKNLGHGGEWQEGKRFAENATKSDVETWINSL